jgi:hypothetical protein
MAQRENMGTDIAPSVVQRVVQGVKYVVAGVTPDSWFGPNQPLQPVAQDQAAGRAFDFPVGYNTRIQPRQEEAVSFGQLRALADGYDLLRLIIETRKEQIEAYEWEIIAADEKDHGRLEADAREVRDFLLNPSFEHDWSEWLRIFCEDMFVLDAVAIYPRYTRGGKLCSLDIVDAATIKRVLDDSGRTPLPPSPAYQQILKGVPAVDYSSDELLYFTRNPRSNRVYGYGPVEQVIMTVNIAIRRQMHQLQYYTEGNVPEAIASVPDNWSIENVKAFQLYWDGLLEGNTGARRHMKFVPFDVSKLKPLKEPQLKDEYDEWLARVICFAFSISSQPFIKQMNRATAESAQEAAQQAGIMPMLTWIKRRMDYIIRRYMGRPDLQFRWKVQESIDPATQANINVAYVKAGILGVDEVRETMGRDPLGVGPMIYTATGAIPFDNILADVTLDSEENAPSSDTPDYENVNPSPTKPNTNDPGQETDPAAGGKPAGGGQ